MDKRYGEVNENSYDFLWRVDTYFIFANLIYTSGYEKEDFIFVYEKGQYFTFVAKDARKRLGEKALQHYYYEFGTFKDQCLEVISVTNDRYSFYEKLNIADLSNEALRDEFQNFLHDTQKVLSQYFTLDYHSMDEIARISLELDPAFDLERVNKNLEELGNIKLQMREAWNPLVYAPGLIKKFLLEVAKRLSISETDIFLYTQCEILDVLAGNDVAFIDKNQGYLWGKKIAIPLIGQVAYEVLNQLWVVEKKVTTLKGQIGSKGYYKGRVKKIDYGMDLVKETAAMEPGSVLVAVATGPELVLACKKAGAIVTDEGGIISHASIIARELGIPAVIGTRQATLLLNDGDEVVVDANTGVVTVVI